MQSRQRLYTKVLSQKTLDQPTREPAGTNSKHTSCLDRSKLCHNDRKFVEGLNANAHKTMNVNQVYKSKIKCETKNFDTLQNMVAPSMIKQSVSV